MRHIWLGALLALSAFTGAAGAQAVSVEVGTRAVAIASPGAHERASLVAPMLFKVYQAGLPPTHRLVEAFISADDIEGSLAGRDVEGVIYQVQVMRDAERVDLDAADWQALRPELARQMAALDMDKLMEGMEAGASERVSDATGVGIELAFGELGRMQLYGDDPGSVRFHMLMPVSAEVAGQRKVLELQAAGAALPLRDRLVFLYAFRRHRAGEDAAKVRAALDRWVEATVAANRD